MPIRGVTEDLIHPTAEIGPEVELAPDTRVGAFAILEGPVQVGPGCVIEDYACLSGPLILGANNVVERRAVLGKSPQSRTYQGEETLLVIGDGNSFGEFVTVHRGTADGGGLTSIGHRNRLLAWAHLGHDVHLGNGCTIEHHALIAGHVEIGDGVFVSAHNVIQQRVRVGRLARLSGLGGSTKDIPPFVIQKGYNCVTGLNVAALRRAGFAPETIQALRVAHRILYREGRAQNAALEHLETELGTVPEVFEFVTFVRASKLGINPARDANRKNWCDL